MPSLGIGLGVRTLGGSADLISGGGTFADPTNNEYILDQQQTASGAANGTITAGAWRTRAISTEVHDPGNHAVLAANRITLDAGTYYAFITSPSNNSTQFYTRLQNVTDGTTVLLGSNEWVDATAGYFACSFIVGLFTIAAGKQLEVQHFVGQPGSAGTGVGLDAGRVEVFNIVQLFKLA